MEDESPAVDEDLHLRIPHQVYTSKSKEAIISNHAYKVGTEVNFRRESDVDNVAMIAKSVVHNFVHGKEKLYLVEKERQNDKISNQYDGNMQDAARTGQNEEIIKEDCNGSGYDKDSDHRKESETDFNNLDGKKTNSSQALLYSSDHTPSSTISLFGLPIVPILYNPSEEEYNAHYIYRYDGQKPSELILRKKRKLDTNSNATSQNTKNDHLAQKRIRKSVNSSLSLSTTTFESKDVSCQLAYDISEKLLHYRERRKIIQACRILKEQIKVYEKKYSLLTGSRPSTYDERLPIYFSYNLYKQWKRVIRVNAARVLQLFFYRIIQPKTNNQDKKLNNSLTEKFTKESNCMDDEIIQSNSETEKLFTCHHKSSMQIDQLPNKTNHESTFSNRKVNNKEENVVAEQSKGNNYANNMLHNDFLVYDMSTLKKTKRELKNKLKQFDTEFTRIYGYSPTKIDKEKLRDIYEIYNHLKSFIVKREKSFPNQGKPSLFNDDDIIQDKVNKTGKSLHQRNLENRNCEMANDINHEHQWGRPNTPFEIESDEPSTLKQKIFDVKEDHCHDLNLDTNLLSIPDSHLLLKQYLQSETYRANVHLRLTTTIKNMISSQTKSKLSSRDNEKKVRNDLNSTNMQTNKNESVKSLLSLTAEEKNIIFDLHGDKENNIQIKKATHRTPKYHEEYSFKEEFNYEKMDERDTSDNIHVSYEESSNHISTEIVHQKKEYKYDDDDDDDYYNHSKFRKESFLRNPKKEVDNTNSLVNKRINSENENCIIHQSKHEPEFGLTSRSKFDSSSVMHKTSSEEKNDRDSTFRNSETKETLHDYNKGYQYGINSVPATKSPKFSRQSEFVEHLERDDGESKLKDPSNCGTRAGFASEAKRLDNDCGSSKEDDFESYDNVNGQRYNMNSEEEVLGIHNINEKNNIHSTPPIMNKEFLHTTAHETKIGIQGDGDKRKPIGKERVKSKSKTSLKSLRRQKRDLFNKLREYEKNFEEKYGRKVMSQDDIEPVVELYSSYQQLKTTIQNFSDCV